jgi:hypothetical protein
VLLVPAFPVACFLEPDPHPPEQFLPGSGEGEPGRACWAAGDLIQEPIAKTSFVLLFVLPFFSVAAC